MIRRQDEPLVTSRGYKWIMDHKLYNFIVLIAMDLAMYYLENEAGELALYWSTQIRKSSWRIKWSLKDQQLDDRYINTLYDKYIICTYQNQNLRKKQCQNSS